MSAGQINRVNKAMADLVGAMADLHLRPATEEKAKEEEKAKVEEKAKEEEEKVVDFMSPLTRDHLLRRYPQRNRGPKDARTLVRHYMTKAKIMSRMMRPGFGREVRFLNNIAELEPRQLTPRQQAWAADIIKQLYPEEDYPLAFFS